MHKGQNISPRDHEWIDSPESWSNPDKECFRLWSAGIVRALQNHGQVLKGQKYSAVQRHADGDFQHCGMKVPAPWQQGVIEVPGPSHVKAKRDESSRIEKKTREQRG